MRKRVILAAVVTVAAAAVTVPALAAETPVATTVTVSATGASRPLTNPAWFQNQTDVLPPGNLASVTALHPQVTRLWVSPGLPAARRAGEGHHPRPARFARAPQDHSYQAFDRTKVHTVTFNPGVLPWTGRSVRMDGYLVDAKTSNYNADPAKSALQKVESVTLAAGASAKRVFTLQPNAVSLLVYTPLPLKYETGDLPTT